MGGPLSTPSGQGPASWVGPAAGRGVGVMGPAGGLTDQTCVGVVGHRDGCQAALRLMGEGAAGRPSLVQAGGVSRAGMLPGVCGGRLCVWEGGLNGGRVVERSGGRPPDQCPGIL